MCQRYAYGADPSQHADLYLPVGPRRRGVVVIIHGGYWRSPYSADLGIPLAEDLRGRGYICWNLEYRRVGNGGGWPETFEDIAAGIDLLAEASAQHDFLLEKVTALGHSAGGHLAVWAAGRGGQPLLPGNVQDASGNVQPASRNVRLTGVISQSGLLDLAMAHRLGLSGNAAVDLLGVPPEQDAERWLQADPMTAIPLGVPVIALHGDEDDTVPLSESTSYVDAAVAAGADVRLVMVPGNHFGMTTPGAPAWEDVVSALAELDQ